MLERGSRQRLREGPAAVSADEQVPMAEGLNVRRSMAVMLTCTAAMLGTVMLLGCAPGAGDTGGAAPLETGVIMLRYTPGSESTEQRERGFLETLAKEFPEIHVLSSDQYAGTTPESSVDKAQQVLTTYGSRVTGVFCVCEPNATGMLKALEEADLAGKVKFVGFDPTPPMVQAMAEGKMEGIVLQDPVRMGYLAVRTMYDHLEGKEVPKRISTGEYIATPQNMNTDEMKRLLNPEQFTDEEFQPQNTKYIIAVIPKGTTHEFWKSVHAGARNAARELGDVEIRWKGPQLESDRETQIQVVEDFTTNKVDGICLAPLDAQALIKSVSVARDAGIPTVIFDSDLADDEVKVSYVATDNYVGGALAARRLADALGAAAPENGK